MAQFYQEPNPTNDPNYSGASKEPDKVQPIVDASLGQLFENIGHIGGAAIKTADSLIKDRIGEVSRREYEPILDKYTGNLSPEETKMLAGTGAKGRVRMMQMQNGAPVYDDGDAGVATGSTVTSFAPADAQTQMAIGLFDSVLKNPERELPKPAQNEFAKLERLQAAYNAGSFSKASFDAEVYSTLKKVRAQFPGYADEVDAWQEKFTGEKAANAVRRGMMSDIQANQAAMLQAQNSDQKFRDKYRPEIAAMGYDPDSTPISTLRPAVSNYIGDREKLKAKQLRAEAGSPEAEAALSDTLALEFSTSSAAMNNQVRGSTPYALAVKQAQEMSLRGGGKPEELNKFINTLELQKQADMERARQKAYAPIEGDPQGHSMVTKIKGGDAKFQEIANIQVAKRWDDLIALAKSGNFSALQAVTDANKYQSNIDVQNLNRQFPQARVASAINTVFPNNPIMANRFIETSDIMQNWQRAIKNGVGNAILGGSKDTPAPTPSEAVKAYGPNAATSGTVYKETAKQYDLVISKENKNIPNAAHVATQFFSDRAFYDNLNDTSRLKLFMTMVSPEKTKFIQSIASQDPSVLAAYEQWAKYAAGDIFRRNADDLKELLSSTSVDVRFNPSAGQFEVNTPKLKETGIPTSYSQVSSVQQKVNSINNAITLLKPIVGEDPGMVLNALGIDPTPPKEDGLVKRMFDALGDKLSHWRSDMIQNQENEDVRSGRVAPKPGKQSMNDLPAAALRQVTAEAESGGDYNAVFGMGKNTSRDLSGHTVGEIMALQQHYTDSGSPSSAIGKYQFLRKTLQSLVDEGVIARDEPFTPDVQERAFTALANRRGLSKFMNGEIDEDTFINNLAKEWAGLPATNGMSFYQGDGLNKATVSPKAVKQALARLKQEG